MDKTERETRDFMNVETFSQLPFIRPAPTSTLKGKSRAIRLFGKEFGASNTTRSATNEHNNVNAREGLETNKDASTDQNMDQINGISRKFECHYCCRNFPTSQALGGHQNAHKRERQHAKRAHFQSVMVHGTGLSHEDYGLMNYSCLAGSTPSTLNPYNHSWNSGNSYGFNNNRLYSNQGFHHHSQPITGSPLALWRSVPSTHSSSLFSSREHASTPLLNTRSQIPFFDSKDDNLKPSPATSLSSQTRLGYEKKPSVHQDNVSLDLHL